MNIISKTALANFRQNKSRNLLIGIAIVLTTLLLTVVPTVVFGEIDAQFKAVNEVYPTFHAMYRNVDDQSAGKMQRNEELAQVGLRTDVAFMACKDPDISIPMLYCDENALKLNRTEIAKGRYPEKEDEIVVSNGLLEAMGIAGDIGDRIRVPYQAVEENGLGYEQEKEFTIVGMMGNTDAEKKHGLYSAFISQGFAEASVRADIRRYRVYFRIAEQSNMNTDQIEEQVKTIASRYQVAENDVVVNTDYLFANYVDPSLLGGVIIIMAVVVLAGILTIYSIYYVSMMQKVQEYGKLKAIGATKRQIRQLVFREGFTVALIAAPVGLIAGAASSKLVLKALFSSGVAGNNELVKMMVHLMEQGKIAVIRPWVLLLAAAVSLLSVYISLLRPMSISARISPVEAIRYTGEGKKKKKKSRRGYEQMDTRKLTMSNLGRNKRRTLITILTLGMTGILFMVAATVISCMDPAVRAREEIRRDVSVKIDYSSGDKMHPELELNQIQKDNPLNDQLKSRISALDSVKKIEKIWYVEADLKEMSEEGGEPFGAGIQGLDKDSMGELRQYVVSGSVDDDRLSDGSGIILSGGYLRMYGKGINKVGNTVHMSIKDGDKIIDREFEVVAVTDAPGSLTDGSFTLPAGILQGWCGTDIAYGYDITARKGQGAEASRDIKELFKDSSILRVATWQEEYKESKDSIALIANGCYGLMMVLGLISILNLVNTMINSVYARRRELGILQAIGLSGKQTVNMLQMEGLFYTAGTLALSLGFGSVIGYFCFLWAREKHIMSITTYQYPVVPALVLGAAVLAVQLLITYLVNRNFKKQSLIDRIRFAQ